MKRFLFPIFFVLCCVSQVYGQIHQAFIPDSVSEEKKECDANLRVLLGAVEVYNMDHQELIKEFRDEDARKDGKLLGDGYLKAPICNPSPQCFYSSEGDLTMDGQIICKIHGKFIQIDEKNLFQEFKTKADKLLASGANVNEKNQMGQTSVHVAIEKENSLILEYLILKGADLNLPDADKKTPLRLALDKRKLGIAQLLIKNKALYDVDPTKLPPKEPLPLLEIGGDSSGLLVKSGEKWEPVKQNLVLERKVRLKTSKTGIVSLRPYFPLSNGKAEYWGFFIFLHPETEAEVEIPEPPTWDQLGILAPIDINLVNGELTVNRDLSERTVLFQAGTIVMESLSGTQKLFYQNKEDMGEAVVKSGYAEIKSLKAPFQAEKIAGFYRVSLEKGKIGRAEQAEIIKYNWPKEGTLAFPRE